MQITFKGSPNFDKGRSRPVKRVVIHWFGIGTLESANIRFQNSANKVSAHYGISKGRVWQWVKETDTAWHSGNAAINSESIGIENDAVVNSHNLSDQDYELLGQLVADISRRHKLPLNRQTVIGHREIKATQCPGTIDLDRVIAIAKSLTQDSMNLVNDNGTYYLEGEKGKIGIANEAFLQVLRTITDREVKRPAAGPQVKVIESANAFLIKNS